MAKKSGINTKLASARLRELMVDPSRFSTDEDEIALRTSSPGRGRRHHRRGLPAEPGGHRARARGGARLRARRLHAASPGASARSGPGVIIDFKYMADILESTRATSSLEVEPGVTWEQVLPGARGEGGQGGAARCGPVAVRAGERARAGGRPPACRFTNKQLSTFHAVLADGREYRSGSDALPNSVAHWREDGGPNISRVFTGSRNSFGLPMRGFVFLYPEPEDRKVVVRGLHQPQAGVRAGAECARARDRHRGRGPEQGQGEARSLGDDPGLRAWSVVFGLEGSPQLVAYHEKRLDELAAELKLKAESRARRRPPRRWARRWGGRGTRRALSFGFYTNFDRVDELSALAESALKDKGKLAQTVIPVKRGASVYVQFDVPDAGGHGAPRRSRSCCRSSPTPARSSRIPPARSPPTSSRKQPAYLSLLKDLKTIMDPDDMLNPGQVVEV